MKKKTSKTTAKKKSQSVKKAVEKKVSKAKKVASRKSSAAKEAKGKKREGTTTPTRYPLLPRSFAAKEDVKNSEWKIIDASNQTLGRLSTQIVTLLMGKHKPMFTRGTDVGDFVIVINAEKVTLTGNKWDAKEYHHHTNYPGGLKTITARQALEKRPEMLIEEAVWRMLPKFKGHLVRQWFKKLKVYKGSEHPHAAQLPKVVSING